MDGGGQRTARANREVPRTSVGQGEQLAFVSASSLEVTTGPIPHGDVLRSIEDVVPGAAAEIVHQAHENMRCDRENETRYSKAIVKLDLRGQGMAYSLTLFFGLASFWLFTHGSETGGITMGVASLAPIVKAFLDRGTGDKSK